MSKWHLLNCDLVTHPNCTRCNCASDELEGAVMKLLVAADDLEDYANDSAGEAMHLGPTKEKKYLSYVQEIRDRAISLRALAAALSS